MYPPFSEDLNRLRIDDLWRLADQAKQSDDIRLPRAKRAKRARRAVEDRIRLALRLRPAGVVCTDCE